MVSIARNSRSKLKSDFSDSHREKIEKWNSADAAIYRYFKADFERRVKYYGYENLAKDVAELKRLTDEVEDTCQFKKVNVSEIQSRDYKELEMRNFVRPPKSGKANVARVQTKIPTGEGEKNFTCVMMSLTNDRYNDFIRSRGWPSRFAKDDLEKRFDLDAWMQS